MAVTIESAKQEIQRLVSKYEALDTRTVKRYKEANTKDVFVQPLFQALGWDFSNLDEVEGEKTITTGRVDYLFKLNKVSKFCLEIKALHVDINEERWIRQAIGYAYNKGVTWAVLTNFKTLRVFNAERETRDINQVAFINLACENYLPDFHRLWLLSREAVDNGDLDREAVAYGRLPPRMPIEKRLYAQLRNWRETLFNEIYLYYKDDKDEKLSWSQVDQLVQHLLNRLIFIRTVEDRGLIDMNLLAARHQWEGSGGEADLMGSIRGIFKQFANLYDSELFPQIMDPWDSISIHNDRILSDIIQGLYEVPGGLADWKFDTIGSDVLGAVYEQYLGYVPARIIKEEKEAQKRLFPEEPRIGITAKKEKRKGEGIYYTPPWVVDYIIKQTVGRFIEERSYNDILNIKILDPACGSGSFLTRAYEELLNYHAHQQGKTPAELDQSERTRILLRNIYGVDLDQQAVEITRLSLLLCSLSGQENLPPLADNIRMGNSLVSGSDEKLRSWFGDDYKDRKPFNWEDEFHEVFLSHGKCSKIPSITIDTCCINAKKKNEKLNLLEQYAQSGFLKIVKTDVLDTELSGEERKKKAANLQEDNGIGVIDHSRVGHMRVAGEEDVELQDEIIKVLFQKTRHRLTTQQLRDAMHLHTHLMHHRDFFVTKDKKHILNEKETLKEKFGINVGSPEECYHFISKFLNTGFDVVVGNPPYVRIQTLPREDAGYYRNCYKSAFGSFDIYVLFLEKAVELLKPGGHLGFITSGKFLKAEYGRRIQQILHESCTVENIIDLSTQHVFTDATTYPAIVVLRKGKDDIPLSYTFVPGNLFFPSKTQPIDLSALPHVKAAQEAVVKGVWPPVSTEGGSLLEKISEGAVPLSKIADRIFQGLITSADKVYILEKRAETKEGLVKVYSRMTGIEHELETVLLKPLLSGKDVERYGYPLPNRLLIFPYKIVEGKANLITHIEFSESYPRCWEYLLQNRLALEDREGGKMRHERWYAFGRTQNLALHDCRKMAIPRLVKRLAAVFDQSGNFYLDNVDVGGLILKEENREHYLYIMGLLNSHLLNFYIQRISVPFRGGFYSANRQFLEPLPIYRVDFDNTHEKKMHDDLVKLVDKMLELNKRLAHIRNTLSNERDELMREIERTDRKIDNLVYDLYGLTDEERQIVEEQTNGGGN